MIRHRLLLLGTVVMLLGAFGCRANFVSGTRLSMGQIEYQQAFAAASEVIRKHYELKSADPDAGVVTARPKPVDPTTTRILGGTSPARQIASIRLQEQEGQVVAIAEVRVQRQGSAGFRQLDGGENYSTVPNQTPAQGTAATTPEQNEAWETQGRNRALERKMLNELYQALHPTRIP